MLSFENNTFRTDQLRHFCSMVESKDYNIRTDEQNVFDQSLRNDIRTYGNIGKIVICQENDYTTGCLLEYPYFKENSKLTEMKLSKQQKLYVDPKEIKQISFTFYRKSRMCWEYNNVFYYQRSQRNYLRFFTRSCFTRILNVLYTFYLVLSNSHLEKLKSVS